MRLGSASGRALPFEDVRHLASSFWKRVAKAAPDECWPWLGGQRGEYGSVWVRGHRDVLAHRVAAVLAGQVLPAGLVVRHSCDNTLCVNPGHLKVGTQLENKADCVLRGRSRGATGDANVARKHPEKFQGERNGRSKLTLADVAEIRRLAATGAYQRDLAARFGVGKTTIGMLLRGETWRNGGSP